ncbi:unnamed protein product [Urochloa humidicola]
MSPAAVGDRRRKEGRKEERDRGEINGALEETVTRRERAHGEARGWPEAEAASSRKSCSFGGMDAVNDEGWPFVRELTTEISAGDVARCRTEEDGADFDR